MARVTVEDCLRRLPNRYELVLVATERARQIERGSPLLIAPAKGKAPKPPVAALREIAAGLVDRTILDEAALTEIVDEEVSPRFLSGRL